MSRRIASLLAVVFALATGAAWACPGDKAMGDGKADTTQTQKPKPST